MAARSVNFYLVKIVRISSWILLALMLIYLTTGFALCGKFGLSGLIDSRQAMTLHKILDVPLLVVFLTHVIPSTYLAFKRWRGKFKRRRA